MARFAVLPSLYLPAVTLPPAGEVDMRHAVIAGATLAREAGEVARNQAVSIKLIGCVA